MHGLQRANSPANNRFIGSQQTIQPVVPAPATVDILTMLQSAIPPALAAVHQPPILHNSSSD